MEGKRNSSLRSVTRRFEPHRLEEQVWAMAYEQVWPLLRRAWKARRRAPRTKSDQSAIEMFATARRA
jgi:hypothetical protein